MSTKTVLDFSARFPSGDSIKRAGHSGAVLYISPAREPWMKAKPARKDVLEDYRKHGLGVSFVWQYGSGNNPDVMHGYAGGLHDAKAAKKKLDELGYKDHPVFFAVDFDINLVQWNGVVVQYFKACCEVLGKHRVGIYGHSRVVHWAMEDDVVARVEPNRVLGWVTRSWSNGQTGKDYAVLYQGTHNVPGPDGVQVDINTVWYSKNYGNYPVKQTVENVSSNNTVNKNIDINALKLVGIKPNPNHRGDPLFLPAVLRAFGVTVQEYGNWKNIGHGDFGEIQGVIAHHTGTNTDIPGYIQNHPQLGLCSQIHLARNGTVQLVGAGIAYHAGVGSYPGWLTNNANRNTIGIEAASDGISPWPAKQLDAYYRTVAAILWYLGKNATTKTIISHWEYSRAAQGKWDPGAGNGKSGHVMDMNHFRKQVQKYIDAANNYEKNIKAQEAQKQEERIMQEELKEIKNLLIGLDRQVNGPSKNSNPKGGRGWQQLGVNNKGQWLTLVDALAALRQDVKALNDRLDKIENNK